MQEDVKTVRLEEGYTEAWMIPRHPYPNNHRTKGYDMVLKFSILSFDFKLTSSNRFKITSRGIIKEIIFTTYIYFCVNG